MGPTLSGNDKGVKLECLALEDVTSDQYFMQDRGQHYKYNTTSGQYFKHDCGQGHPQDSQRNSIATFSGFLFSSPLHILNLPLTVSHYSHTK